MDLRDRFIIVILTITLIGGYFLSRPLERQDKLANVVGCYKNPDQNQEKPIVLSSSGRIINGKYYSTFKIYEDKHRIYLLPKLSVFFYGVNNPKLIFSNDGPNYYVRIDPDFRYITFVNISGSGINLYKTRC